MSEPSTDEREVSWIAFRDRAHGSWVERTKSHLGSFVAGWDALAARPAVDVEGIAREAAWIAFRERAFGSWVERTQSHLGSFAAGWDAARPAVDVDEIAREIARVILEHQPIGSMNLGQYRTEWMFQCGHRFITRRDDNNDPSPATRQATHQARAVVAYLAGESCG
jgi:hypothetical protein